LIQPLQRYKLAISGIFAGCEPLPNRYGNRYSATRWSNYWFQL
jgi:hypothetical protein